MTSTSNIDTNIKNYTLSELMSIAGVNDLDEEEINEKTNFFIQKFKNSNPSLSTFFLNVQGQLLQYAMSAEEEENNFTGSYPAGEEQTETWLQNEYMPQTNPIQREKITDRKQEIDIYNSSDHTVMKRKELGVSNTFNVPVSQDSLNPNLKNTINRIVNLDSQFRQYSSNYESTATDYTLDLSDPLANVLSIRLYSYQIPYSWYIIDEVYGNSCFWITDNGNNIAITIPSGNYSTTNFVSILNSSILTAGFTNIDISNNFVSYNSNNGKLTLNLYGSTYSGSIIDGKTIESFIITTNSFLTFYDYNAMLQCSTNCVNSSYYLNQTLGWIMGFREPYITINEGGNTSLSILDLNGPKYLILVLDDYNQNHINNGLVSITEYSNNLKLPNYYSPDLPYICVKSPSNFNSLLTSENTQNPNNPDPILISGKLNNQFVQTPVYLPSAPRTLTQSQLYTINQINKNNNNNTNYRAKAPTSTDVLSMIPIKTSGVPTGSLIVEFSGSLQDNVRTYFGPVNIERMRLKLLDDKGNILNLNGSDWCITLICECLYQY
jgi:hypothetical protein